MLRPGSDGPEASRPRDAHPAEPCTPIPPPTGSGCQHESRQTCAMRCLVLRWEEGAVEVGGGCRSG
eukprot:1120515-Rhodomonas_salina.1